MEDAGDGTAPDTSPTAEDVSFKNVGKCSAASPSPPSADPPAVNLGGVSEAEADAASRLNGDCVEISKKDSSSDSSSDDTSDKSSSSILDGESESLHLEETIVSETDDINVSKLQKNTDPVNSVDSQDEEYASESAKVTDESETKNDSPAIEEVPNRCKENEIVTHTGVENEIITQTDVVNEIFSHPVVENEILPHLNVENKIITFAGTENDIVPHTDVENEIPTHPSEENEILSHPSVENEILTNPIVENEIFTHPSVENEILTHPSEDNEILTQTSAENDINTDTSLENDIHTDTSIENDSHTDTSIENDSHTDTSIENDSHTDTSVENDILPNGCTESEILTYKSEENEISTHTNPENETVPQTVTESETVSQTVTESETVPQAVTESETVPQTVTERETIPQTVTETETVTYTVTENETVTHTVTENEVVTHAATENETVAHAATENEILSQKSAESDIPTPNSMETEILSKSVENEILSHKSDEDEITIEKSVDNAALVENEIPIKEVIENQTLIGQNAENEIVTPEAIENECSVTAEKNETEIMKDDNIEREEKPIEKYSIQYKGFKKKQKGIEPSKIDRRISLKGNPFNPASKKDLRGRSTSAALALLDKTKIGDPCTLQPEYAQYLGLQPNVKFRCSNCGMSSFQSMSALNTHQIDCKKMAKVQSPQSILPQLTEPKSTNIKLTRKVFLCSACGTYYENWNLFLHMREVHRRYICLYCLGMFSTAGYLAEHLMQKHKLVSQNFTTVEEFQKNAYPTYFLLCLNCNQIFSETDNFYSHTCSENKTSDNATSTNNSKGPSDSSLNPNKSNSPKVVSPESKPPQKSSGNITKYPMTSKRVRVDWGKRSSKTDFEEDYVCTAASFCRVDLGETQANAQPTEQPPSKVNAQPSEEEKTKEEKVIEKIPSDVQTPEEGKTSKNDSEPENFVAKVKDLGTRESTEEAKIPSTEGGEEKRKGIKRQRSLPIKKQIKKKRVISVGKNQKKFAKNVTEVDSQQKFTDHPMNNNFNEDLEKKENQIVLSNNDKKSGSHEVEKNIFKIKLQSDVESDGESDDSHKLSLVVDENASVSDSDVRKLDDELSSQQNNSNSSYDVMESKPATLNSIKDDCNKEVLHDEIQLAGEEVAAMALTLDDKIDNVKIQSVVKECVRTSCLTCNYCRHAVKIAVNGKQLALHILSEHRYTPVKNETCEDVVRSLKNGLDELNSMFFNTETYDSSDPAIHIPYDKDNNFDCFQCNYVTNSHRDLYAHKRKSHTKSLLLCIMCKSNFYSYSELLCHLCPGSYNTEIQFHNTDISFRCCFCRLDTIPSAFRLMVHLRKCHHTCDICLEICTDQQKLSTHMWKHKLNHLCYRCGIAYASKPDITKHLFWKHGTESVLCKKCLQKKWPHVYHFCIPPTSFICEECNTSFSKAVALKVHKRLHAGDFSYSCSHCDKKFVSKKLLARHEERHKKLQEKAEGKGSKNDVSSDVEQKEEMINITDVMQENKDTSSEHMDSCKDLEVKDKSHKKHKKEKDKKLKQVVDVVDDLPPLNLSSESDSSEDEEQQKSKKLDEISLKSGHILDKSDETLPEKSISNNEDSDNEKVNLLDECKSNEQELSLDLNSGLLNNDVKSELDSSVESSQVDFNSCSEPKENNSSNLDTPNEDKSIINDNKVEEKENDQQNTSHERTTKNHEGISDEPDSALNVLGTEQVEDIWEKFYMTNSQNKNLPYPLCAMKSEIAYGIIMGDHDYCQQYKNEPIINEDVPSTSNLDLNPIDEKMEVTDIPKPASPLLIQEISDVPIPTSAKKKQKSPKKKNSKNNTSSSSDSSSDSDSSSCSCGTNCSCSSSSSNSSSSTSSDSDSSSTEGRQKQEKRRKRKDKRIKIKEESSELIKEPEVPPEVQTEIPAEPEDPPIRESELETDETSTDEDFYDRQPQRIANQLLAEKRNQLMLLASVAPVNNGTSSPTQIQETPVPEQPAPVKQKQKTRRRETRKKVQIREKKLINEKPVLNSIPHFSESIPGITTKHIKTPEVKILPPLSQATISDTAPGSGSETESTRSSKRRRIPNKFYGYSSGEEEDKQAAPPTKWRKQDIAIQSPKRPSLPPSTPRIQLTVPKQVIRKQFNVPKPKSDSSSNDSDSGSDSDSMRGNPIQSSQSQPDTPKADVYCYCRCPYDEVSEMIACDDENCKIEWFHFECVGILVPPRGQWYCPECRKRRGLPT